MSLWTKLFGRRLRRTEEAIERADKEIEEKSKTIEEMDHGIHAIQPTVDEAIKRTDDGYYEMRHKVGVAERRLGRENANPRELALLEKLVRDVDSGWRRRG